MSTTTSRPASNTAKTSRQSHRSTLSLSRTEIIINVYDLLPPGRLSCLLWSVGASLLHSGVVINGKEYAYGGHDQASQTGVYWTMPQSCPPGGTFRVSILHGFTFAPHDEIDSIIRSCSEEFQGTGYNLLTKNCNHFTQALCEKLTGRRGPAWLNRAAQIGVALPCVVPRDWIDVPDLATAGAGELAVDEDDVLNTHEGMSLMRSQERTSLPDRSSSDDVPAKPAKPRIKQGKDAPRDSSGRKLPPSERALRPVVETAAP